MYPGMYNSKKWDEARSTDLSGLDFHESDVKDFSSNQKSKTICGSL